MESNRAKQIGIRSSMDGEQGGDSAKLAQALVTITDQAGPPLRFIAGADAIATAEQVVATLQQQISALRELSTSLSFEAVGGAGIKG